MNQSSTNSVFSDCPVLQEMLETGSVYNQKGEKVRLHSHLSKIHAQTLYETVLQERPSCTIEVGMSCGTSSLAILTALNKSGGVGRLISVDPNQTSEGACGLTSVLRADLGHLHQLLEKPDYVALPKLLESGMQVDMAYIDGWHTFDYTLLDFFYIDKMLKVGGVVIFNDCGWPAVFKAMRFVVRNRKYAEINVGLPRRLAKKQDIIGIFRGGTPGLRLRMHQDRYFRKKEQWEPNYNYFAEF